MADSAKKTTRKKAAKKKSDPAALASAATTALMCKAFGMASRTARQIATDGCPRNPNGTWNLPEVHRWLMDRAEANLRKKFGHELTKGQAQKDKIAVDIEWKRLQIAKQREELIERELHEMVMGSRMSSLRNYLEDSFARNAHHFVGKPLEAMQALGKRFAREMMNNYLHGSQAFENAAANESGETE